MRAKVNYKIHEEKQGENGKALHKNILAPKQTGKYKDSENRQNNDK